MKEFSVASFLVAKSGRKAGSKANPTMQIDGTKSGLGVPSPPLKTSTSQLYSVLYEPQPSNRAHDPVDMVTSAAGVTYVLSITEDMIEKSIERNNLDPTSVSQKMQGLPGMTDEQLDQAMTVIPGDYWRLRCWKCCEPGFIIFKCRNLSPKQRVLLSYCYFIHQVSNNLMLKAW